MSRFRSCSVGLVALIAGSGALGACGAASDAPKPRPTPTLTEGQSEFESAPPNGSSSSHGVPGGPTLSTGDSGTGGTSASGGSSGAGVPPADGGEASGSTSRAVEETDLYRLEGDRLYYLNSYRGLMVFDVSDVDHPALLGRSPIYGEPVEMVVHDGIANVVVADWYGTMDDGTPFHGSIVRGIDARDPANMAITGEAYLGGWVRDTRVVGDVIYAVTEKYPYDYGWYGGDVGIGGTSGVSTGGTSGPSVSVSSVSFANAHVTAVDHYDVPGYGGVFHVTENAILLAAELQGKPDANGYTQPTGQTRLSYLDISDPAGMIRERGSAVVQGSVQTYGADNGRWNLDFADEHYAHVVASAYDSSNGTQPLYVSTVDFGKPDAPVVTGSLTVPNLGYSATARFDSGRLYLSSTNYSCFDAQGNALTHMETPLHVYDVSNPTQPRELGSATLDGQISLMMPNGQNLFALGNTYDCTTYSASPLALAYFDLSDPTHPRSLGTAEFGKGWAYTPAAGTFKAFTLDAAQGLVVLPFSGWDYQDYTYNNGVQLIEFTDQSIRTSGTGHTHGWVERGIFVKNRLVSLSDLALSVIDYSNHDAPVVVSELTLARNVVNARPVGDNLVEVSSDFWDNDMDHSELRVVPKSQADETTTDPALATLSIPGTNPTVFHDGNMTYVVSNVRHEVACPAGSSPAPTDGKSVSACYEYSQAVSVVDVSGGGARLRGSVELPGAQYYGWGWGWGWYGCDGYSWYYGSDIVQVGKKLAFRRWLPQYDANGYVDALESLFVVDASNPDAPTLGSTVVTDDRDAWWGNLRAIGNRLYASHYEWLEQPSYSNNVYSPGRVGYYVDEIDLSDAAHPKVGQRVNVPGFLVGGSEDDPSLIYTMDYQWDGTSTHNEFAVLKLDGGRAYLQGHLTIPGYTGNVFVEHSTAYFSAQTYVTRDDSTTTTLMRLYQVDLSDPAHPVVLPSAATDGWGWLLAVEGDHAFVTSGWYNQGVDIFKLQPGHAPVYEQFVRTRGWWTSSLAVDQDQAFVASGYWGTQTIDLSH
jgi:hypothetical protein